MPATCRVTHAMETGAPPASHARADSMTSARAAWMSVAISASWNAIA